MAATTAPSLLSLSGDDAGPGEPVDLVVHDGCRRVLLTPERCLPRLPDAPPGREVFAIGRLVGRLAPGCGIAEVVPVPARSGVRAVAVRAIGGGGRFATRDEIPAAHRPTVDAALAAGKVHPNVVTEIEAVSAHPLRQRAHRSVVRPLIGPFSSAILRRRILRRVPQGASVIDVSCGDDRLILDLARRSSTCVANDVSLAAMHTIVRADRKRQIGFTLQSTASLRLRPFDVVICKNTLHHLDDAERAGLFRFIRERASEAILVDIVDVSSTRRSRFFNAYYRRFLDDCGTNFLGESEIDALARRALPGWTSETERIDTLKGRYALTQLNRPARQT
jgi:hypothetical protein